MEPLHSTARFTGRAVSHPAGGVKDGSPVMVFGMPTSAGQPAVAQLSIIEKRERY